MTGWIVRGCQVPPTATGAPPISEQNANSAADQESLDESREIMSDHELMESLDLSRQQAAGGGRLRLLDHVGSDFGRLKSRPKG